MKPKYLKTLASIAKRRPCPFARVEYGTLNLTFADLAITIHNTDLPSGVYRLDALAERVNAGASLDGCPTIPADNLPVLPVLEWGEPERLPTLIPALRGVSDHLSNDPTRHALQCALLDAEGVAVAVDGHRLATLPLGGRPAADVLIPADAINALIKLSDKGSVPFLQRATGYARVNVGNLTVYWRLPDTGFPDYRLVIRVEPVRTDELPLDAFEPIRPAAAWKHKNGVKAHWNGALTLTVDHPDFGSLRTEINTQDGPEVTAGYNPRYLLDAVDALSGEDGPMTLSVGKADEPILIKRGGGLVVVMPIRL